MTAKDTHAHKPEEVKPPPAPPEPPPPPQKMNLKEAYPNLTHESSLRAVVVEVLSGVGVSDSGVAGVVSRLVEHAQATGPGPLVEEDEPKEEEETPDEEAPEAEPSEGADVLGETPAPAHEEKKNPKPSETEKSSASGEEEN